MDGLSKLNDPVCKRDRRNENVMRALNRLMRRCNRINQIYGAEIYLVTHWNHRYTSYISTDREAFPPTPAALVS